MGLDQQLLQQSTATGLYDFYDVVLEKRNCYPLQAFILKWLWDRYKISEDTWAFLPLGPYIQIPGMIIEKFCTALEKRNKGGGYRYYNIWSKPGKKLKVPNECEKKIPPLIRGKLEERMDDINIMTKVASFLDGSCKYDRMFLFPRYCRSGPGMWDYYPEKEQRRDIMKLRKVIESRYNGEQILDDLHYYASW